MCSSIFSLHVLYRDVQPLHGPGATRGRRVQCKGHKFCGYVGKIKVKISLEQLKIVVTGKSSTCEYFLQSSRSGKKLL